MHIEYIKTVQNVILGTIETDSKGDQTARVWPGRQIVGYYRKDMDRTTDLLGRVISQGNSVAALIFQEHARNGNTYNG